MTAIVRPARMDDLPQLAEMLAHVDRGMITMPQTPEAMEARIQRSLNAFARPSGAPEHEAYFLLLEEAGRVIGTASIFTNLGSLRPFYSYRVSRQSRHSPETGVSVETDVLHLVNDHHGDTELGTLFIMPGHRGGGRGKLLSFARLMLMAVDPLRFGPRIMAEIRGWTDEDGYSPFWEGVGRKFFQMDYQVADKLSMKDHRFIADLMPRYPVYVNLLPKSAQDVIAKPHPNAEAAKALLETQGFRYNSMVDIFDAGPCVECYTDSIEIVRSVERMSARDWAQADNDSRGLVSRGGFADFCVTSYLKGEDRLDVLSRLGVQSSDEILAFPYKEARKWRMKN